MCPPGVHKTPTRTLSIKTIYLNPCRFVRGKDIYISILPVHIERPERAWSLKDFGWTALAIEQQEFNGSLGSCHRAFRISPDITHHEFSGSGRHPVKNLDERLLGIHHAHRSLAGHNTDINRFWTDKPAAFRQVRGVDIYDIETLAAHYDPSVMRHREIRLEHRIAQNGFVQQV